MLPHGYEGQGAEHSSARVERYLQLCAKDNMFVANCSTPSNLFHLLRRQIKLTYRKPLIIFTPKSLLRHPLVVSKVKDFTDGNFKMIIDDCYVDSKQAKKLVFCSGKFYYDLYRARKEREIKDVAFVPWAKSQVHHLQKSNLQPLFLLHKLVCIARVYFCCSLR